MACVNSRHCKTQQPRDDLKLPRRDEDYEISSEERKLRLYVPRVWCLKWDINVYLSRRTVAYKMSYTYTLTLQGL